VIVYHITYASKVFPPDRSLYQIHSVTIEQEWIGSAPQRGGGGNGSNIVAECPPLKCRQPVQTTVLCRNLPPGRGEE